MCAYQVQLSDWKKAVANVAVQRERYVERKMEEYDNSIACKGEQKAWKWSPLFLHMVEEPVPGFLRRPFLHTVEEFSDILTWMKTEILRPEASLPAPPLGMAVKMWVRTRMGPKAPMVSTVHDVLKYIMKNSFVPLNLAMKDVVLCGHVLFPTLDRTSRQFASFEEALRTGEHLGDHFREALDWARFCFFRSCLNMLSIGREDHLRAMWVEVPTEVRDTALESFQEVMLLLENIDIGWVLGSVDCLGEWPEEAAEALDAAKRLRQGSISRCHARLTKWAEDADCGLQGTDSLDDFGNDPLCTMDHLLDATGGVSGQGPSNLGRQEEDDDDGHGEEDDEDEDGEHVDGGDSSGHGIGTAEVVQLGESA